MRNFCGHCGTRLDPRSGLCPKCDKGKIRMRKLRLPALLLLVLIIIAALWIPKRTDSALAEEAAVPATTETAQWPEVELVTDALFDDTFAETQYDSLGNKRDVFYYHIPKINLNLPGIQKINEEIYQELYGILAADGFPEQAPCMHGMAYSVAEKGDVISILVCFYDRWGNAEYWDDHQYVVYNVNRKTGEYVTDVDLVAFFGFTRESFQTHIAGALTNKTREFFMNNGMFPVSEDIIQEDEWTQEWYMKLCDEAISGENRKKVMPYIDAATGDLCIAATIPVVNSDGRESATINLTGSTEPADPETYRDITAQWGNAAKETSNLDKKNDSQIWTIRCEINGYHFIISYLLQEDGKAYCATGLEKSEFTSLEEGTYEWENGIITFSMNIGDKFEKYAYAYDAQEKKLTQVSDYSPFATHEKGTVLWLSDQEEVSLETFEIMIANWR